MARRIIAFVLAIPLVSAQSARAATEVNSCGQAFSGSAFLSADLDCTGFPTDAVIINKGGTLDLRGFTVTGGGASAVFCSAGCKIVSDPSGGRIIGASYVGVDGDTYDVTPGPSSIRLENVVVSGNAGTQVIARGNISVVNGTIVGAGSPLSDGLDGNRVSVVNSTIENTNIGIIAGGAKVIDSEVSGCLGDCLVNLFRGVLVKNSTITGAGGVAVRGDDKAVRIVDSTITNSGGNGIEVFTTPLRVTNSNVSGNLARGILSGGLTRLVITDSLISGNGEDGISHGGAALVRGTTITANGGNGIVGSFGLLSINGGSTITGNVLDGVLWTSRIRVTDSTISSNGRSGISTGSSATFSYCEPVSVDRSTLEGNGTNLALCGVSETCADIATCGDAPSVADGSTCETSYDTDSGFPGTSWGVCSLD